MRLALSQLRLKWLIYMDGYQTRMPTVREARFAIGDVVRHRHFPFRGVVFDVDPEFANTEEWWLAIPERIRPHKDQPFYHVLAENEQNYYTAYVSEQNLLPDAHNGPVGHPEAAQLFAGFDGERYAMRDTLKGKAN